ncbi:DUF6221 family protein [Catenuloplanes japonicus]|uniref:DUF6221 family protein n=1 Tax=Catenuloplanes japonicus TaxID=33876 RepID=UPI0005277A89|nr:DUF6221 family protein [Catenuloplanes japonicus]
MTAELVAFLRTQLDEDERVASAAADHSTTEWAACDEGDVNMVGTGGNGFLATGPWGGSLRKSGVHMARWDPTRVLAEIDAKRRILDLGPGYGGYNDAWSDAVHALAQPYAGREGWREEWKA